MKYNNNGAASLLSYNAARGIAVNCGFTEAGVVALPHGEEMRDAERFTTWIDAGCAGEMQYLLRRNAEGQLIRARVNLPFPWARSAILCLASYHNSQAKSTDAAAQDAGWIARYAWTSRKDDRGNRVPSDYHRVLMKRLKKMEEKLREEYGAFEGRAYVDSGPVVERALATAAGLGWTAKNTCLIHPKIGSYAFLGVLITSLDVDQPEGRRTIPDRCGTCTRCIDACPTDALDKPYQMDATRCISYLTIEHKGEIAPELMEKMGRQVFGCDICQDVCPWNRKAVITTDEEMTPREELLNPALEWLAELDERAFESTFNGSPVRRARFDGLRRNVAIAMGNTAAAGALAACSRDARFGPRLREWAHAADEGLRAAAAWALKKLEGRGSTAENR